jgi:RsiW-degrading membrane proteinase PrsW (M82 family)
MYLVIGALAIGAAVLGYMYYKERQTTSGIDINVNKDGVSIETK